MIAESYERIHRSNLVGMGILPLQFPRGRERRVARPDRRGGLRDRRPAGAARRRASRGGRELTVRATGADGTVKEFRTIVRIDTPQEIAYYQHGGILQYVLRQLASSS